MGIPRTLPVVTIANNPTPAFSGTQISAVSFSINNGIATIVLGAGSLPTNGYNGPNGYPQQNGTTGAEFDIFGGTAGGSGNAAGGQQVSLWGFTTATYFNGKTVTVLDNNPTLGSFRFYFNHANVASTNDAGITAASPFEHYRAVRIECDQSLGTDIIYVGDLNVSSTRYMAALSLTGQLSIEVASENIPADRIWLASTANTDKCHITTIY